MAEPIQDIVKRSIIAAESHFHRLVLLVGTAGTGKTAIFRDIAKELGLTVVNLNVELSKALLELTERQRSLRVQDILEQLISSYGSVVILDNIEVLFDTSLRQDPLRLLQGIARNRTVVAAWNGVINAGKLYYAEIGHPEYRRYDTIEALAVRMDGAATITAEKGPKEAKTI